MWQYIVLIPCDKPVYNNEVLITPACVDKVSRGPHDDGLGWSTHQARAYLLGTWYLVPGIHDI